MRFVEHEKLNTCVHCGLCLAACPTYLELGTETDSPRGRIHLMRALEEGALQPTREVVRHLDLCLGCRACEPACPSGVPYGSLIEAARPFVERHRSWLRRLGRRALVAVLTTNAIRKVACGPLRLVGGRKELVRLASRLSSRWLALAAAVPRTPSDSPLPASIDPPGRPRGTAALVTGCVAESLFSATNRATARLLVQAGVRVLAKEASGLDAAGMRQLSDTLMNRIKSGVVVLGRTNDGKASLIVRTSDDLTKKVPAGQVIKELAPIIGGRGGGKADMAEGGGNQPEKLSEALQASYGVIEKMLT